MYIMEEKYYIINLINPVLRIKGQQARTYLVTQERLEKVLGKCITLDKVDINHRRYIKGIEEVELIEEKLIEREKGMKEGIRGIEEVVNTDKGKVKIVYTHIRVRILYLRGKNCYYRGYIIEKIRNLGIRMYDGLIPLDKINGITIEIKEHNKRTNIRKGVSYINNELKSYLGYIDKESSSKEGVKEGEIEKGLFIEEIM